MQFVRLEAMLSDQDFVDNVTSIPANAELLIKLEKLNLPQCYLTAGCLFQPIWNQRCGNPDLWGINDFDVFYFDEDTSWDAENHVIERAAEVLAPMPFRVEIRNQARVHLWYEERFGSPISPLESSRDGIGQFLVSCTCVGIEVVSRRLYAPYGLADLWNGVLRMNTNNPKPDLFIKKAASYQSRWPWLSIQS